MKRTSQDAYLSSDEDWEQAIVQAVDQILDQTQAVQLPSHLAETSPLLRHG